MKHFCAPSYKSSLSMIALILSVGMASHAQAQYAGPGALPVVTSLSEVLERPVDDQRVRLQGHLVKQLSSDKYLFSDGRQEMRVEIDHEDLPTTPIDQNVTLLIEGEVEKDFMTSPEIDVDRLSILQ